MSDLIHKPKHYCFSKFEPKDVIRAWGLNFNLGSVIKYIARAGRKDDIIQDLKKAREFLTFEIDALEEERGIKKDEPDGIRISDVISMRASEFTNKCRDLQNGSGLRDALHFYFIGENGDRWILTQIFQDTERSKKGKPLVSLRLHFERLRIVERELSTNELDLVLRD